MREGRTEHGARVPRGLVLACAVMLVASLGGCAARQATRPAAADDQDYAALYSSGRYQKALEDSSRVAGSLRAADKPRARLIAGLSAHALNRNAEAVRWLTPLVDDADRAIAGKSSAALGLIHQQQGEHPRAAALLGKASKLLEGDDAARAALYAGDSHGALGERDLARAMYETARRLVHQERGLQALIGDRLAALQAPPLLVVQPAGKRPPQPRSSEVASGAVRPEPLRGAARAARRLADASPPAPRSSRYCAQAGVYVSLSAAVNAAGNLKKFGKPRVAEFRDSFGRRLYGVRLGNYSDPNQAEALCRKIGRSACVAPIEER